MWVEGGNGGGGRIKQYPRYFYCLIPTRQQTAMMSVCELALVVHVIVSGRTCSFVTMLTSLALCLI